MDRYDYMDLELQKIANSMMGYGGMNAAGAKMAPPPASAGPSMEGMPTMGGAPGVTAMKGMSLHCDKCFAEVKSPVNFCPECGKKFKGVRDIKSAPQEKQTNRMEPGDEGTTNSGDTGGEAAVNEELSEGSYADAGKYASIVKRLFPATVDAAERTATSPRTKNNLLNLKAALGLGVGTYGGARLAKAQIDESREGRSYVPSARQVRKARSMVKGASFKGFPRGSRLAAVHFKRRGGKYKSVNQFMKRWEKNKKRSQMNVAKVPRF